MAIKSLMNQAIYYYRSTLFQFKAFGQIILNIIVVKEMGGIVAAWLRGLKGWNELY